MITCIFPIETEGKYTDASMSMLAFNQHQSIQQPFKTDPLIFSNNVGQQVLAQSDQTVQTNKSNDRMQVIPGGQSIGVKLHTKGVLVVGYHIVKGEERTYSPGEEAAIQVGDMIVEMNGQTIEKMEDVKPIVEQAGLENKDIAVQLRRNDKEIETLLKPIEDHDNKYQIGLYVRDSAAGIGTMSFYEPGSNKYGALGHVISDMDTQKPVETYEGAVVRSFVTSIAKGNNGVPGEKKARFSIEDDSIGTVNKNSPFGIFGVLHEPIQNGIYDEPMDIAFSNEVEKGPATILTVLEDERVEQFDIEIVSSVPQDQPETKGMVIKITDETLLEKTGGVVQGMSGSPIIQNNKIIGAITHVFVNDPTSGYGVHIEWMLNDAGIDVSSEQLHAS